MADDAATAESELDESAAVKDGARLDDETSSPEAHDQDPDGPVDPAEPEPMRRPRLRLALAAGLVVVAALGGLAGWLGLRAHESSGLAHQRQVYLQAARQGALNLTTISYTEVDTDIQRILDCATGGFYDDFKKRSQPFVEVVKQAQSNSKGTIVEAGLESMQADSAQALVAVTVTTTNSGAADQEPRAWRMRINVQKVGDTAKVSNVEFVP
jgi:Mce-associated membrane protein